MPKRETEKMIEINKRNLTRDGKKRQYSFFRDAWKRFRRNRTAVFGLIVILILFFIGIFVNFLSPYDPLEVSYESANLKPGLQHPFGTDNLGRDILSRCLWGARYSLPIGLVCMVMAMITGGTLGTCAAFFGGRVDNTIMRIMDIFQSIPGTLLAITIIATLGTGVPQLIAAITISFTPSFSKTVRAAIFTVKGNEYVEAAKAIGAGNIRLMIRHLIPNAVGHVIIFAVGTVAASIMIVSMLSYIGLGIKPPTPEWGAMLSAGKDYLRSYPHMVMFPGLMIMITLFAFNLFGDGLRDALDPRLK